MKRVLILLLAILMLLGTFSGLGLAANQSAFVTPREQLSIDLNKSVVGVMTGSTNEKLVREQFKSATVQCYDSTMDAVTALKAGHVEIVVTGYPTALNVVKNNRDLKLLPDVLQLDDTAIAVRKENIQLLDQLNAILNDLEADGTLQDMQKRWLKEDFSPYEPAELILPQTGSPLRVAVDATREPFCFKDASGKVTGFDGELAQRISVKLGRPVEFYDAKFAGLIPALQSGKADVIISMMSVTQERKKSVNFTIPYYPQKVVMMVRVQNTGAAGSNDPGSMTASSSSLFKSIEDSFYNNIVLENRYMLIIDGLKVTLIITILACILGTLLGALVCFMRMSRQNLLKRFAQGYIALLRGTPVLVLLMFIFYVVFASVNINPVLVAVIAFAMNFAAYVSEMFRAAILSVDKGQTEAGIAGGFTGFQTFVYIVLPQAVKQVLPVYKGELISLAKMTSIVGYIAVEDLTKASDIIRSRTFDAFFPLFMIAVLYFLISWLLLLMLEGLEQKTDPKRNRK
ncbi:MAG: ABC transporter substrate-binding protein/permease [Syntrophomonadaceae bacterium]